MKGELDGCCLSTFENHGLFDCVVLPDLVGGVSVVEKEFFPGSFDQPQPVSVSLQENVAAAV